MTAVNFVRELEQVTDFWSPRVVGQVNDQYVKVAKLKGEFTWHQHDAEDELFYVVRGSLEIQYEDHSVRLEEGDFHVVPRGVLHNPVAQDECWIALIETVTTRHTGDKVTSQTRSIAQQLGEV
ncbi:MAG: cupin domain-containing protein [Xanthomonadales bacterium]|nr:cupin domain-containing protein [Xanthomonadales bacterium]